MENTEKEVKRGNPDLAGRPAGPGALKDVDQEKFVEVWNSVNPQGKEKAGDLLLAGMLAAGISNEHTDISQIRAYATKIRQEGVELKNFKSSAVKVDLNVAMTIWVKKLGITTMERAVEKYKAMTGVEVSSEDLAKTVADVRKLGYPMRYLIGEKVTQRKSWDRQAFIKVWKEIAEKKGTLKDALKALSDAGIVAVDFSDPEKIEKGLVRIKNMAKEIRGLRKTVNGEKVVHGISKFVTEDGKKTEVVVEPIDPSLPRLPEAAKDDAKKAQIAAIMAAIGADNDEDDDDDEDDGKPVDDEDEDDNAPEAEKKDEEEDPFA